MSALTDDIGGYEKFTFAAEFYDHVVPYRERNDVAFFVEKARSANGPALEFGCGTGRVLIPAGYDDKPRSTGVWEENVLATPPTTPVRRTGFRPIAPPPPQDPG